MSLCNTLSTQCRSVVHTTHRYYTSELQKRVTRTAKLASERLEHRNPLDVNICILGRPNTGKCFGYGTDILMYDGSVKSVEAIQYNDVLMGNDNKPRIVQYDSFTHGVGELYRIVPHNNNAESFICNGDHILMLMSFTEPRIHTYQLHEQLIYTAMYTEFDNELQCCIEYIIGEYDTIESAVLSLPSIEPRLWQVTLSEYIQFINNNNHLTNYFRMYRPSTGVEYPVSSNRILLDHMASAFGAAWCVLNQAEQCSISWWLGYWIENGSSNCASIHHCNKYCVDTMINISHIFGTVCEHTNNNTIDNPIIFGDSFNQLLIKLNLLNNKHIPSAILQSSIHNRYAFMAGLIDAAGYLTSTSSNRVYQSYIIPNIDSSMREQVVTLARSIGVHTHITDTTSPQCVDDTKHQVELQLSGVNSIRNLQKYVRSSCNQCVWERLRDMNNTSVMNCDAWWNSWNFDVEGLGIGKYIGFAVDCNSEFLLSDYTVTHNSTLFNKLINKNLALVNKQAGVTRDRHEHIGSLFDLRYNVIDTAGLDTLHDIQHEFLYTNKTQISSTQADLVHNQPLAKQLQIDIMKQTCIAISKSQIILFVIDSRDGLTERDIQFAHWLRTQLTTDNQQHIVLLANKAELNSANVDSMQHVVDSAYRLGFGRAIPISALHNDGIQELYATLKSIYQQMFTEKQLKLLDDSTITSELDDEINSVKHIKLAIVGRPNVGKSSLINSILGEQRCLTGDQPGVTRDSQPLVWLSEHDKHEITLVDTAGLKGV